jgi:hypothetical protein
MAEIIQVQNDNTNGQWNPFVGDETNELLRSKGFTNPNSSLNETGTRVLDETYRIMQVCGDPNSPANHDTGIVIGYVQSGKTLSFTTLTALARDNNYRIVIIIGGTSVNLLDQSTKRVRLDLRIDSRFGFDQKWVQIKNPASQEDFDTISSALDQWSDATFPNERCKTALITVMKNGSHLASLASLLGDLQLEGVPTLIIDDEGDQASLNTRARSAARRNVDFEDISESMVSTIYRRINEIRNKFPHHTFLQYTATPQANLFINIMDRLSPNFIRLLTPGESYTGGIQFFRENPNLIREIPAGEISTPNQPLHEPPDSLIGALRVFYLGVVAGTLMEQHRLPGQRNRSMLVHPSRLQGDHTTFMSWLSTIKESWRRLLSGNDGDERSELLRDFRTSYDDLYLTVQDLPPFETLTGQELIHAIQYTPIVEVNSRQGSTPQISWGNQYAWILVGGQSMDRGFTVEGLSVTYMPRNIGVGNVDTIQQRARFFGYKRSYLGFCRVYLDQVTIESYNSIVEHEEDVRQQLMDFDLNNRHLNDWDREVVLDGMLKLTRANVLYDDLDRDHFGDDWFRIQAPHDTENYIETNRVSVFEFIRARSTSFSINPGHSNRTNDQKHLMARVGVRECLDQLLNKLKFTRETDSAKYSSLRGVLKRYIEEHPDDECVIYLMSTTDLNGWQARERRLNNNDEIQQLFQGRNPRTGEVIYPGDSEIREDGVLTVQIHLLNLKDTTFVNVPTLAIWIPEHIGKDIIRHA